MPKKNALPLWLKGIYTLFLAILIPVYWIYYGPTNFLWFSDITLFLAYLAIIFESSFLASMAAVGGFFLESIWILDFLLIAFFDVHLIHLADYMFNPSKELGLRALSLFHLFLPPLLIFLIRRLGYKRQAWIVQTILAWCVLFLTWRMTDPSKNINLVFAYLKISWLKENPLLNLILMGGFLTGAIALTHCFLLLISPKKRTISRNEP